MVANMAWQNLAQDVLEVFVEAAERAHAYQLAEAYSGGFLYRNSWSEWNRLNREAGLCPTCGRAPKAGYAQCEAHLRMNRTKQGELRERKKKAGICCYPGCHDPSVLIGRSRYYCAEHREAMRARAAKQADAKRPGGPKRRYTARGSCLVTQLPEGARLNKERDLWVTPDGKVFQAKPGPLPAWLKITVRIDKGYPYCQYRSEGRRMGVPLSTLKRETFAGVEGM